MQQAADHARARAGADDAPGRGAAIDQAGERRSARVESLRAVAALSVVIGHVVAMTGGLQPGLTIDAQLSVVEQFFYGGGIGVFFFFALTGYLLFWPFAKRYFGDGERIDLRRYAINRAVRILPLYYVVIVVALAFQERPLGMWARFLSFTENFFPYTAGQVVGPAWSLVVEMMFYALLPLLAWAVARAAGGRRAIAVGVLLALGAASLALRLETVYFADAPDARWRFSLPATFVFFVPGMLLAIARLSWQERRPVWMRGALGRADTWILASIPFWLVVIMYRYELDVGLGVASFLMIGACVLPLRAGPVTQALEWTPLATIGIASYSLYLWHVPLFDVLYSSGIDTTGALALLGIPLSIAIALLSYRAIESPFLRLRRQWAHAAARKQESPPQAEYAPVSI